MRLDSEQATTSADLRAHNLARLLRAVHDGGGERTRAELTRQLSLARGTATVLVRDLADATAQSRSRLSHQITRMEAAGLVRRDTCPGDKRGLFAVLTDTGMATIERVAPYHVDSVRRHFIDRLTPGQLDILREGYAVINDHLREIRERD